MKELSPKLRPLLYLLYEEEENDICGQSNHCNIPYHQKNYI